MTFLHRYGYMIKVVWNLSFKGRWT
jgi:hypothetical protein